MIYYARNLCGAVIEWGVVALMTLLGAVAPWKIEAIDRNPA
ncbi:MAG: hypothetical protein WDN46_10205 [Methylocella sp.]